MDDRIELKLNRIEELKEQGKFKNYIEYMQFPHYKNLEAFAKIELKFPMTILIGKNGSGKSSTLHAFYGAPKGYNCGEYWFSTNVDPILENSTRERNRYFYAYREKATDAIKEVRVSRIKRSQTDAKKEDLDYWETTRVATKDGMLPVDNPRSRNSPVDKKVIYVDFRGELSAFDKYFYFGKPRAGRKKQDYIRNRSKYLEKIFNGEFPMYGGHSREPLNEEVIILKEKYIKKINYILGKEYKEIKIASHRVYETWGTSVLLKTGRDSSYSEANAGSGESSVINLVHKIMDATPFSLILLDEPEVSLHPSAQIRLKEFLVDEIINKKHQVIISTHSPCLIDKMPQTALKLFETNLEGKFSITENITFQEAFYNIEDIARDKKTIICEDIAVKIMIEKVLKAINKSQYFNVEFVHGGAETILTRYLPIYAMSSELRKNVFILLDGDKDKNVKYDIEKFTFQQTNSIEFLIECFVAATGQKIKGYIDGKDGTGRQDQKIELYKQCIKYHYNNVHYLPDGCIPEVILIRSCKNDTYSDIITDYATVNNSNAKEIIKKIAEKEYGEDDEGYYNTIKMIAHRVSKDSTGNYIENIKTMLDSIFNTKY
ncbi:MAG: AAA family ATPase [Lachnospiraceae bacterium]|jgi:predicted ATPase|nr:AAA family ATPase [Lachnospiraceae bacterium]